MIPTMISHNDSHNDSHKFRCLTNPYCRAAALGSMPSSALFFLTYEQLKRMELGGSGGGPKQHIFASSVGECLACLVRVPTEVTRDTARMDDMFVGLKFK